MAQNRKQRLFYKNGQLSSEIGNGQSVTLFSAFNTPLAERSAETTLLAENSQSSIVNSSSRNSRKYLSYTAYGHGQTDLTLGYTGQRYDRLTNLYLLGNGYRAFSPRIMRFLSPDSFSPFGPGGINSYSYCSDDPINHVDPSGHIVQAIKRALGVNKRTKRVKDHAQIEVAQDKQIKADEEKFHTNSKKTELLIQNAKTATHAIPKLRQFAEWYSHPSANPELIKKAAKLVGFKVDLTLNKSDPTGLMSDGDYQALRTRAFNTAVDELAIAIRETILSDTFSTSRRSSLASLQSTSTLESFIE